VSLLNPANKTPLAAAFYFAQHEARLESVDKV
jgi:hypothetical protein